MSNTKIELADQLVLVTGGARGLGAHIVQAFAKQGAQVVINYYQSQLAANQLAEKIGQQAVALQADVRDAKAVASMVDAAQQHFGRNITTLVNNALPEFKFDGEQRAKAHEIHWQSMAQQLDGLKSALNTIQALVGGMKAQRFGRIINIGTNLVQNPVVPYHDYTAAKAALLSLTRTFAQDLGAWGITVNMMSGGLLKTTDASKATPEEVFNIIAANTPLQRVITPEEFADVALFFASPWARSVTGQNLIVDGGLVKK